MKTHRLTLLITGTLFAFALSSGQQTSPPAAALPARTAAMLRLISPAELKGDLSFLASDTLAGRFTPSPGLDVAAEFIASKFRAFGLEPGGDADYFQIAHMVDRRAPKIEGPLTVSSGTHTLTVAAGELEVYRVDRAASLDRLPLLFFAHSDLAALRASNVREKAVMQLAPDFAKLPREEAMAAYRRTRAFSRAADAAGAALELVLSPAGLQAPEARLIAAAEAEKHHTPVVLVATSNPSLKAWSETASAPNAPASYVNLNIPALADKDVTVKNVIGVLRGVDPNLKSTCVLLTAHYDHIGTLETGRGMAMPARQTTNDRIYNGANDDGSGTVSVIEIARALSTLSPRPKRSIVFMTFFGEERGELGSQFYSDHPVFPLTKTVADINLEQVGRTDATTGKQINTASLTGYDYSDVTRFVEQAGRLTGIKVYKDNEGSDAYFTQSDNSPLAERGIPAHSLTVAFQYPDYHGLGDEWQKIDYENMSRVDRMVALALVKIANSATAPAWNAQNAKTADFRKAQDEARRHAD